MENKLQVESKFQMANKFHLGIQKEKNIVVPKNNSVLCNIFDEQQHPLNDVEVVYTYNNKKYQETVNKYVSIYCSTVPDSSDTIINVYFYKDGYKSASQTCKLSPKKSLPSHLN